MLKFSFFKVLLGLSLLAGSELAAQNICDSLRFPISKNYDITAPIISENVNWAVLRKKTWSSVTKMGNGDRDVAMIFRILKGEKFEALGFRKNVQEIRFVGNSHLLLGKGQEMELLDLKRRKSRFFKNVKTIKVLKDKKQFILHYDQNEANKLELRNANGKLLNSLKNVSRFYTSETDQVYAIAKTKDKVDKLLLLKDGSNKTLYRSPRKIARIEIDPDEHGIMIYEQEEEGIQKIRYLNLESNTVFPLEEVLPTTVEKGYSEIIQEGKTYFLRLRTPKKEKDSTFLNIWYGNDNALVEKFYPPRDVHYYWYPKKKKVFHIGSKIYTRNVNIGSARYFISFDPFLLQDYTKPTPSQINIYDRLNDNYTIIDTISKELHVSPNGKYIMYKANNSWVNYNIAEGTKMIINNKHLKTPYFSHTGKKIWFTGNGKLWSYDHVSNNLEMLENFKKKSQITILNSVYSGNFRGVPCEQFLINGNKPLIIKRYDSGKNTSTYIRWQDKKYDIIIPQTKNHIRDFKHDTSYRYFSYIEENYNLPPQWVFKEIGEKKKVLYRSNKKDKEIKQEIITYTNDEGTLLKGVLYYPLHYDAKKKYPMIVHIYQKQHQRANRYPFATYYNSQGFNIRLLLENGYFVYLPDIKIQGKEGPGMGALHCVNNALDALNAKTAIDKQKIGLIGHSFGGYETNFIATHSDRFAAYVVGAGIGNLTQMYFSFNYGFNFPDYYRVETLQFDFHTAFANKKTLFFKNNPVYYAEKINAPVLLWAGMDDVNVPRNQTMAMYIALRRYQKPVVALFYENEAHSLENKKAQADLTKRIMDWFDYFLKDIRNIKWIKKGISKDAP